MAFFVLGKFRSKGLELSLELSRELSWKVLVDKERNSCISLAVLLHNTVHPTENKPKSTWYLPHFPVCHPERSSTKTRIVFDASAKFQGVSLNDHTLPGPKLLTSLFDVLLCFHHFPVAVACDVSEMYLQIRIPPEDCPMYTNLNVSCSETPLLHFALSLCLKRMPGSTNRLFRLHPRQCENRPTWMICWIQLGTRRS